MALLRKACTDLPQLNADVIVIGAGTAGWTTARRAQQLGLSVIMIEKGDQPPGNSNALLSGGLVHAAFLDMKTPPDQLYERVMQWTEGRARPELARTWAANCARSVEWLKAEGAQFEVRSPQPVHQWVMAPYRPEPPSLRELDTEAGPYRMHKRLSERFLAAGGQFVGSTRVTDLLLSDTGAVCGVLARSGGHLACFLGSAVILADGGFQANPEMLVRYVGPRADEMLLRGAPNSTGDGIRMALSLGAKCVDMGYFYGRMMHRDALHNAALNPFPMIEPLVTRGILVNQRGLRIADEGTGIGVANSIVKNDDPRGTTVLFDQVTWEEVRSGLYLTPAPNPLLIEKGATLHRAESLSQLAEMSKINADGLAASVAAFNAAVAADCHQSLPIPHSGNPHPITEPPFYAIPAIASISITLGGLLTAATGQVLDVDERPIPGLYAAGDNTGGLQGGTHRSYLGGFSVAMVFGLACAESVRASIR